MEGNTEYGGSVPQEKIIVVRFDCIGILRTLGLEDFFVNIKVLKNTYEK